MAGTRAFSQTNRRSEQRRVSFSSTSVCHSVSMNILRQSYLLCAGIAYNRETLTNLSSFVFLAGHLAFYCLKWQHWVRLAFSVIPIYLSIAVKSIYNVLLSPFQTTFPSPSRRSPIRRDPSKWASAVSSTGEKPEKTSQLLQRTVCINCMLWNVLGSSKHQAALRQFSLILRHSIIKGCCQWKDQDRPSLEEVSRKLVSAEKSASDKVLKVPTTVNIERYLQEAGYGETNSYTVFWLRQYAQNKLHYSPQ